MTIVFIITYINVTGWDFLTFCNFVWPFGKKESAFLKSAVFSGQKACFFVLPLVALCRKNGVLCYFLIFADVLILRYFEFKSLGVKIMPENVCRFNVLTVSSLCVNVCFCAFISAWKSRKNGIFTDVKACRFMR